MLQIFHQHKRKKPHYEFYTGLVMCGSFILMFPACLGMRHENFTMAMLLTFFFTATWQAFLVPYRLSGDPDADLGSNVSAFQRQQLQRPIRFAVLLTAPIFIFLCADLIYFLYTLHRSRPWRITDSVTYMMLLSPQALFWGCIYFLVIILTFAVAFFMRTQIRQRLRLNLRTRCVCVNCGYDLRGTPDTPCPECGHNPQTA